MNTMDLRRKVQAIGADDYAARGGRSSGGLVRVGQEEDPGTASKFDDDEAANRNASSVSVMASRRSVRA